MLAALREYFKYLIAEELLSASPASTRAMPKKERKSRVYLRQDEYMKFLSAAAG
jgi:site-specific recombinase XerD